MADVATPVAPVARKAGRPRKYADPLPGEPMTQQMKVALHNRERARRLFNEDHDALLERVRVNYHARKAKARETTLALEALRASILAIQASAH